MIISNDDAQFLHPPLEYRGRMAGARLGKARYSTNNAFNTFQRFSATILCPSALGWIWSAKFNSGFPPTPSSRNGTSAALFALATSGKTLRNAVVYSWPILGGI